MSTFDPFDKKAASVQAARDREVAERAKKMQAEADSRRKKQLLQTDIAKLQQEITRRNQESKTLSTDIEKITKDIEQKKKEVQEVERDLQAIERRLPEESQKVKLATTILDSLVSSLRSLRTKISNLSTKERTEAESVQNKNATLATATQKKELLENEYNRLDTAIKKTKSDVDKEKKELVQKQTNVLKIEREQQLLGQSIQTTTQKIHELEREIQTLREGLSKHTQDKSKLDSDHTRETQVVQTYLHATQNKDAEIYRLTQEYDRIRRELDQQKDVIQRAQSALTQDEGTKKRDEAEIVKEHGEEERLLKEEKTKRAEIDATKSVYEKDLSTQKSLQTKKMDTLTHVSTQSFVLQQRQQRLRVLDGELKKFESELQQKEREMQQVRF